MGNVLRAATGGGMGRAAAIGGLIAWIILALLVINPLARLLLFTFQDPESHALTLTNYVVAFSEYRYIAAYGRSLLLGITSVGLCLIFALPMAWAVARTNMPCKSIIRILTLCTFVIPPYLGAISWILLAGENAGWINRAFTFITGVHGPIVNIFTFSGLVFVVAIYSFPYIFFFTDAALNSVSSDMEEAANILGAGKWATTYKITFPLVMPAILASGIITFLEAISLFGSPALIALPARVSVVTTQLWEFFSFPIRAEVAAAYSMPLLVVTVLLFWARTLLLRKKSYVTVTGKSSRHTPIDLGWFRWLLLAFCFLVLSLAVILPVLAMAQAALAKAWGRGLAIDNFTLANFRYILFEHVTAPRSILNTFVYSAWSATLAVSVALLSGYLIARKLVPFPFVLSAISMTPFVIPGIVLGIGFYAAYTTPPLVLYGTATLLVLAFTARFLPIAFSNSTSAIQTIHPEMEDAVRVLGGSRYTAIRRVIIPLLKQPIAAMWLLVFVPAARELSTAIFLYSSNTRIMSILLFDLSEEGNLEHLCALGLLMLLCIAALAVLAQWVAKRQFVTTRVGA